MRQFNKEMRLQEAEKKKRQKEDNRVAKQANIQLQNDIKSTKKSKKKAEETIVVEEKRKILLLQLRQK
jgi:hypothetical protein